MLALLLAAALAFGCDPQTFTVRGDSLAPLVQNGQEIEARPLSCAEVERGDLVAFTTSAHPQAPVIKRVEGVPGDTLSVMDGGAVEVNGAPAADPSGAPYVATAQGSRMIRLYRGVIPPNAYLVLGRPGSLDSGRIGLIPAAEITGVVKAASPRGPQHP